MTWRRITLLLVLGAWGPAAFAHQDAGGRLLPGDTPPPTAFSRLADAGDAEDHTGFNHIVVHDLTVNRVDEQGVASADVYVLYKVLDAEGCRELSALRWGYEPRNNRVDVREVNLIRDGKRISVDIGPVLDLPAPQSMMYWNNRIKLLQLPRLREGDGVEVRTLRTGFSYALLASQANAGSGAGSEPDGESFIPPMPGEYFDIVLFPADVPVLEKRYEVHLPPAKRLHTQVYNGPLYSSTTYGADGNVYAWWGFDLPATPHEPHQADHSDIVTKVSRTRPITPTSSPRSSWPRSRAGRPRAAGSSRSTTGSSTRARASMPRSGRSSAKRASRAAPTTRRRRPWSTGSPRTFVTAVRPWARERASRSIPDP
ncbi:MAG: DUF3857 domain-containing protein [Planctomycetota bacterium]